MFSVKGFLSSIFGTLLSIHVSYASLDSPQACNFIKKDTPTQVFSCALCEIFKNTLLREHLLECSFVHSVFHQISHLLSDIGQYEEKIITNVSFQALLAKCFY